MFIRIPRTFVRTHMLQGVAAALILSILPLGAAHAAADCASTFQMSGDPGSGLVFDARTNGIGVNARDALGMVKKIASDMKLTMSDGVVTGDHATIELKSVETVTTDAMDIEVALDRDSASIKATYPPHAPASEAVMRDYLCRFLGQIRPGAPMSVAAPTATYQASNGSGPMPGPFTPAKTQAFCLANATFHLDAIDDKRAFFRTWTLYDGGDGAQAALARVKAKLAAIGGMRVTSEHYVGQQGTLGIFVDAPGKMVLEGPPAFAMRLDIDESTETVSLSAAPRGNQVLSGAETGFVMCSLVAAATRTPEPPAVVPKAATEKRAIFTNPFKKKDPLAEAKARGELAADAFELVRARAAHAGKGIVIMPLLDMDTKYQSADTHAIQVKFLAQYWGDRSGVVVWRARGRPGDEFTAGSWGGQDVIGLHGFFGSLTVGKSRFAIFYLDPGTYDLSAASQEQRGAAPPPAAAKRVARAGVGSYVAKKTEERGFFATKEWRDATHETRSSQQSACVTEEAGSGRCVESQSYRQQYNVQTSEAGYVNVIHEAPQESVDVSAELSKPFASFDVTRGEVVLIDGFVPDLASFKTDPASCEASADTTRCSLSEFSLWRIPTKEGDIQHLLSTVSAEASIRSVIGAAKLRPVTISATALPESRDEGVWETGWARRYVMKVH